MISRFLPISVLIVGLLLLTLGYFLHEAEREKQDMPLILDWAQKLDFDGQYVRALEEYTRVIHIDKRQEDAWHGKGKILNHLLKCNEAKKHYSEYLRVFPDSQRAKEGYDIALSCKK